MQLFVQVLVGTDHQGDVGFLQRTLCLADTEFAQLAFVVEAGRINEYAGTETMDFHGLKNRVGGRAGDIRHKGCILMRQGINQ